MFFKKIETKGLAHYSYMLGDGENCFVIDPMRDIQQYADIASQEGYKISHIFETHRNEDYVSGSLELSSLTGATIYISGHEDLGYEYGEKIHDGDTFEFGEVVVKALHTPGHTKGHLSYVVYESERDQALLVFTGDCLFMGDLGRTDFYEEDELEEMTGHLYESIFNKLMPLGDHVIALPAHGNGSACGETMEERPFTTLGYERIYNPNLQVDGKEDFIENFAKMRIKPRYFEKMEVVNVEGPPFIGSLMHIKPLNFYDLNHEDIIVDLRSPEAFATNYIPGSIFLNINNLASFLGTLLDTESSLVFMAEDDDYEILMQAYWTAKRIGFDKIHGYLKGGLSTYVGDGCEGEALLSITANDYVDLEDKLTVDIRGVDYLDEIGKVSDSEISDRLYNIPLKIIHDQYEDLPKEDRIYVLCNSGNTATTASSFLTTKGYNPVVILGGITAVESVLEGGSGICHTW